MGIFRKNRYDVDDDVMNQIASKMEKGGKVYRWLFNIALFALFVPIAVIVVGFARGYITAGLMLAMSIVVIIGAASIMSLYWIRFLENKEHVKVSIVFLALTLGTAVVWIISAIIIYSLYNMIKTNANANPVVAINFIKAALILSIQFITANFIARMVIKYKKSYMAVQVVAYASNVYIDIWLTLLLICAGISKDGFSWNQNLFQVLVGPTMLTLLVLAFIYSIVVNNIIKTTDYRKLTRAIDKLPNADEEEQEEKPTKTTKKETSVEEKLEKLKQLYQNELITKEEYEKKRNDILSDM